jgi:hypothetical protein
LLFEFSKTNQHLKNFFFCSFFCSPFSNILFGFLRRG